MLQIQIKYLGTNAITDPINPVFTPAMISSFTMKSHRQQQQSLCKGSPL